MKAAQRLGRCAAAAEISETGLNADTRRHGQYVRRENATKANKLSTHSRPVDDVRCQELHKTSKIKYV